MKVSWAVENIFFSQKSFSMQENVTDRETSQHAVRNVQLFHTSLQRALLDSLKTIERTVEQEQSYNVENEAETAHDKNKLWVVDMFIVQEKSFHGFQEDEEAERDEEDSVDECPDRFHPVHLVNGAVPFTPS